MTDAAWVLDVVLLGLLAHTMLNAALVRRPRRGATVDSDRVSILLPVRNEAARVEPCLRSLLAQRDLPAYEVLVYDDESTDGTADVVRRVANEAVRLVPSSSLPDGWLGKPHACAQLAKAASGSVLVFVDADVTLAPDAVAGAVGLLRETGLAYVSPYPCQVAVSWLERLVQPLLPWSWLTFLPLRLAEGSSRPSLAAANGQFTVIDSAAYQRAGGHGAVRDAVVEDMALARRLTAVGARGVFVDGHELARCRMYDGARALVDGYAKSAWIAFGSPASAVAVAALSLVVFVVPWLLLAVTPWAAPAAVAGPAGRLVTALRSGNRPLLDAVAHPLSVLAFVALVAVSIARHRRGRLSWKDRPVP